MATLPSYLTELLDGLPFYEELSSFTLFGNSGIAYIMVAILFVFIFVTGYVLKFIILSKVRGILPQKGNDFTEPVLEEFSNLINFTSILFLSIYLSTLVLSMPSGLRFAINLIAIGYVMFVLYKFIAGIIDVGVDYRERSTEVSQEHILSFFKLIAKIAVASLILLWYLALLDVNITGFVAGLGIAGLTIAFALQNIAADLFSAVAIYLDKPFELGDYITVNDKGGVVERIGIRSTHIRSSDGPLIVMSNQNLTSSDVTNYGKMQRRRVQHTIGVSAEASINQLRSLPGKFKEITNSIDLVQVDRVWLKELGNYSWNFEIIYFINDPDKDTSRKIQSELNFRILELMEEEGIDLPYPIQEIILNPNDKVMEPIKASFKQKNEDQSKVESVNDE